MAIINPAIIANYPQSTIRQNVNTNFTITALTASGQYPSATRINIMGGLPNNQQLYIARDGSDYLSADTGVLKGTSTSPVNQTFYGNLTVTGWIKAGSNIESGGQLIGRGISISPNGTALPVGSNIITDHLWVGVRYSDLPSFVIDQARNSRAYGTLTVDSTLTVSGQTVLNNNVHISGSTYMQYMSATAAVFSGTIQSSVGPGIQAFGTQGAIGAGSMSATNAYFTNLTTYGTATLAGPVTVGNPGGVGSWLVRPLLAGSASYDKVENWPVGALYGRW